MTQIVKPGDTIEILQYCPDPEDSAYTYDGLPAKVLEVHEDGSVRVELICSSEFLGIGEYATLQPGSFRPAALYLYDVTVTRTGVVEGVLAANGANAMRLVDLFIKYDDVNWSEDWPATDAERQKK